MLFHRPLKQIDLASILGISRQSISYKIKEVEDRFSIADLKRIRTAFQEVFKADRKVTLEDALKELKRVGGKR